MKARAFFLVVFIVALLLLMGVLTRWASQLRADTAQRQWLAQRGGPLPRGVGGASSRRSVPTPPIPLPAPVVAPSVPVAPTAPRETRRTIELVREVAPPVLSYLSLVNLIEKDRHQTWSRWQESLAPQPTPTPSPELPPTPPLDLLAEAAKWDKRLSGSVPDSSCLPFHLAYQHYLAQERDYIQRLTFYQQQGDSVRLALLQAEEKEQRVLRLARLQGRLREIQLAHPNLPNGLKSFRIE